MALSNELTKTQTTIAPVWGDRSEIREMVARFRAGLPNAKDIPDIGLLALATASLAHGLDPWNGEIWCIFNKNTGETSLMAGIKGLRKAAKRQMTERFFYDLNFRDVPPEEWSQYATDIDEKGRKIERISVCTLRRQDATSNYLNQLAQAKEICGSFEEARAMVGEQPRWIGVGIVRVGEKSKMEKTRLARKRAEGEATTQAFDLPFVNQDFNGSTVTVGVSEEAIEGDYREGAPESPQEPPSAPDSPAVEPEVVTRPYTPEQFRAAVAQKVERNPVAHQRPASEKAQNYTIRLILAGVGESATKEQDRHAVQNYITDKASIKDWSTVECNAVIELLADETKGLGQDGAAEIQAILRACYQAEGQLDMFDQEPAGEATPE